MSRWDAEFVNNVYPYSHLTRFATFRLISIKALFCKSGNGS